MNQQTQQCIAVQICAIPTPPPLSSNPINGSLNFSIVPVNTPPTPQNGCEVINVCDQLLLNIVKQNIYQNATNGNVTEEERKVYDLISTSYINPAPSAPSATLPSAPINGCALLVSDHGDIQVQGSCVPSIVKNSSTQPIPPQPTTPYTINVDSNDKFINSSPDFRITIHQGVSTTTGNTSVSQVPGPDGNTTFIPPSMTPSSRPPSMTPSTFRPPSMTPSTFRPPSSTTFMSPSRTPSSAR